MMSNSNFENIYDKYCSMLYGLALQICSSNTDAADEILISTFKKIYQQDISQEKYPAYCITLVQLVIKTAGEFYPLLIENGFRLKQFEKAPLINQFICNQISLQDYCKEKYLTPQEALQTIRKEFSILGASEKENFMSRDTPIFG